MSVNLTLEVVWRGLPLVVSGSYYPGYRGCFYKSNGDPGDPPEPPEFDIGELSLKGLENVDFFSFLENMYTKSDAGNFEDALWEIADMACAKAAELEQEVDCYVE